MKLLRIRKPEIFGLFLAAILASTFLGCGSHAASEPDNFRNIKWGVDASSVPGLNQVAGEDKVQLYEKNDDKLEMGEVKLDQVVYGFYKGRFYMGMVYFPSVGFKRVEEILTRQFGQPAKPDNTPSKLIWDGSTVSVLLMLADSSEQARLVYLYKPIQLEVELKK
jgi:hypothetical protein